MRARDHTHRRSESSGEPRRTQETRGAEGVTWSVRAQDRCLFIAGPEGPASSLALLTLGALRHRRRCIGGDCRRRPDDRGDVRAALSLKSRRLLLKCRLLPLKSLTLPGPRGSCPLWTLWFLSPGPRGSCPPGPQLTLVITSAASFPPKASDVEMPHRTGISRASFGTTSSAHSLSVSWW